MQNYKGYINFFPFFSLEGSDGIYSNTNGDTSWQREIQNFCWLLLLCFLNGSLLWSFDEARLHSKEKKKNVWSQGEKKIKNGGFKAAFASAFVEIKACPPVLCAYWLLFHLQLISSWFVPAFSPLCLWITCFSSCLSHLPAEFFDSLFLQLLEMFRMSWIFPFWVLPIILKQYSPGRLTCSCASWSICVCFYASGEKL